MKYLVLILVILVVVLLAKAATRKNDAARRPEPQPKPKPTGAQSAAEPQGQVMLACAQCGLHLPRDEALPGHGRAGAAFYCSEAHRVLAESRDARH